MHRNLALSAAILLSACGSETAAPPGPATGTANPAAIASPDTSPAAAAMPWPTGIPQFAAAYPGGVVTSVGANIDTTASIITFNTADNPAAVVAFYSARAAAAGLPRIAALSTRQSSLYSAGDPATGRALTIQAAARNGHTAAALTISPLQPERTLP